MLRWFKSDFRVSPDKIFSTDGFSFDLKNGDYVKLKAERTGLSMSEAAIALLTEVAAVHARRAEFDAKEKAEEEAEQAELAAEAEREEAKSGSADRKVERAKTIWASGYRHSADPRKAMRTDKYLAGRGIVLKDDEPSLRHHLCRRTIS
jgi:hypothetical protein